MAQSARASPGGGTAARTRLMRRSELVTVPSFRPSWRRQQHIGEGAVSVSAKASCTTTNSAAAAPRAPGPGRAGLRRVGAGDPQRLDLAAAAPASNISTAVLPGVSGTSARPTVAPLRRGARGWPGRGARRAGWPARRPRARPWRWAGRSAKRPGAGLADLAGGQVQVDQRGVLVDAAAGLVQALAIQRQRRPAGEPARRLHDVGRATRRSARPSPGV
jgi:hypothetical protein